MLLLIANEKGGVGKTTLAVNLTAMCALAGKETLLVDTDTQESSSSWAAVRSENLIKPSIVCVSKTGKVGHDLLGLKEKFDIVIIDAGGRDSIEMRQSMAVADLVIIPIRPAQFDLWSLARMSQLVKDIAERTGLPVRAMTTINGASSNPMIRETQEIRKALLDYADDLPTTQTVITERIAFRKASRMGQGVVELIPGQADAKANLELMALYKEIFDENWKLATTKNVTAKQQSST